MTHSDRGPYGKIFAFIHHKDIYKLLINKINGLASHKFFLLTI